MNEIHELFVFGPSFDLVLPGRLLKQVFEISFAKPFAIAGEVIRGT